MDLETDGVAPAGCAKTHETEGGGERRLHHVTRIDIEPSEAHPRRHPTHGWQVRARRDGTRLSKFFADAKHGGRDAALDAAMTYRDDLLASITPPDDPKPRKAWSNTGVVGLSVREKTEGDKTKLYVQLNWVNAAGKRRAGSYSVEKWGFRRALWNGCLRLYRERAAAGSPVEEVHVMFARAQEPFADLVAEEIAAEKAAEREAAREEAEQKRSDENREQFESPEARAAREEDRLRKLEDTLFG
ncbi:hypothetical protein RQM47_14415 [Rubrivirga sp. S365]|uniref:AP2 domain-containing protein n=1 Tax=Rubrivirga litoralis TaxID=3075598 RepID=A0ABU3BTT9_9BACT|nr:MULTISPECIES: hypothetical protein [unclassified Rubrivirga]MDT0632693.1 hypothetical protein [Rubrivirga sp. F394]MDT7857841.1 hypothetical protein [Rubrivirga sp. S365]